jgi:hypothetical protein
VRAPTTQVCPMLTTSCSVGQLPENWPAERQVANRALSLDRSRWRSRSVRPVRATELRLAAVVGEYRVHHIAWCRVVRMSEKVTEFVGHGHAQHVPVLGHARGCRPAVASQVNDAVGVAGRWCGEVVRSERGVERDPGVGVVLNERRRHRLLSQDLDLAAAWRGSPETGGD